MMRELLLLTMMCSTAWACSCVQRPSAKDAWLDSPLGRAMLFYLDPGEKRGTWVASICNRFSTVERSYETVTDGQGVYEFRNLRQGAYTIEIAYPKGTRLDFVIPAGKTRPPRSPSRDRRNDTGVTVTDTSGNGVDFVLALRKQSAPRF